MKTKRTFSDWLIYLSGKRVKRNSEAEDMVLTIDLSTGHGVLSEQESVVFFDSIMRSPEQKSSCLNYSKFW